jgi:NAD(P)-dependent dehydrogenase (short-subunit alcohol dehydrogenase family)
MAAPQVAVVVGVGPGLGAAVARRFAREGFGTALVARRLETVKPVEADIVNGGGRALSVAADATDESAVKGAFARIREFLGAPNVLVYNAGSFHMGPVLDAAPQDFVTSFQTSCLGAFLAVREAVPGMVSAGGGTVIFTGATASLRGAANFSALAAGKCALRALAQALARELGPKGVHVAHVVVDGVIDTPRIREFLPGRDAHTLLQPDAIAETYWNLHSQDRTAWTLECDLRPAVETF